MTNKIQPGRIAIQLTKDAERQIKGGHPWIYQNSIVKQNKEGKAGDQAIIFSRKNNKMMAIGLYDPQSPIRIKIVEVGNQVFINAEFWERKLKHAVALRKPLTRQDTNGYRLVFGENDGFPGLIIDVFNQVAVCKVYSPIWIPYWDQVIEALHAIIGLETIVLRLSRTMQMDHGLPIGWKDGKVIYGELTNPEVYFKEHGLTFIAHVIDGHKTGFFLDHRHNRRRVGQLAQGKNVLDVFSYAGGFSVHALAGGATEVTSVDISRPALDMAHRNATQNGLATRLKLKAGDAFEILSEMAEKGQKFDLIIIDPPTFAAQKSQVLLALKKYQDLAFLGAQLIEDGGMLVLASCSSQVPSEVFFEKIEQALNKVGKFISTDKTFHDIDHPVTFPQGNYLKCGYYTRTNN